MAKEKISVSRNSIYKDLMEIGNKYGHHVTAYIAAEFIVAFNWWQWPALKDDLLKELKTGAERSRSTVPRR